MNCRQKWRNTFCHKENCLEKSEKRISQTNIKIIKKAVFKKVHAIPLGKVWTFFLTIQFYNEALIKK